MIQKKLFTELWVIYSKRHRFRSNSRSPFPSALNHIDGVKIGEHCGFTTLKQAEWVITTLSEFEGKGQYIVEPVVVTL